VTPGSPIPYTFALIDHSGLICKFFIFDHPSANVLSGRYVQYLVNSIGDCILDAMSNITYPMSGARTSTALLAQTPEERQAIEQQAIDEGSQMQAQTAGESDLSELTNLMLQMQQGMRR
jgi:hypothetical protein